jgi:hypothetical protein
MPFCHSKPEPLLNSWASWAVQSGVTLDELMLLSGWRSFPMVLRYAHFAPHHLALAAAKVRLKRRTKTGTLKPGRRNTRKSPLICNWHHEA